MKTPSLPVIASLFALPAVVGADLSITNGYLAGKPLVLEVRYCTCAANGPDGKPSDLLPAFMEASSMLQVGVTTEDKGFIASDALSMGYEVKLAEDEAGAYRFSYSGIYAADSATNSGRGELVSGRGELVLGEGEWVTLFGVRHDTGTASGEVSVAVRLLPTGS